MKILSRQEQIDFIKGFIIMWEICQEHLPDHLPMLTELYHKTLEELGLKQLSADELLPQLIVQLKS